ncbi:DNA polymerase III subunit delta' [Propionicicella superfundia]|uniref:DNA polymerase III subunit delta' n=1 Tax=Propionicicella superfundia TaxID=348582 RepID=UPI00041D76D1|nr:DNA polymerase III subunit delta' [Propionicicella superfundia]
MTDGVWADLIGQSAAVETLRAAVAGGAHAMTHAWLITGPPGSGRSNAAKAFAAALQCPEGGCGVCSDCRSALAGSHPEVTLVRTELLSIGVDEVRDLVVRASMAPRRGRYQVLVIEDADLVTERGADALLKSIEEPAPRTVWVLCAPTADDVVVTLRSRCRHLHLRTPREADIAELLVRRDGIDPAMAAFAARAAQGHIGRARVLARDDDARRRRHDVLVLPSRLSSLGACLTAAAALISGSSDEARAATSELDARELAELSAALGIGAKGARPRSSAAAVKELEDRQKTRVKRLQRDALDRVLTEFTAYYRDVLTVQTGAGAELVNPEVRAEILAAARACSPVDTVRRLDAILACRVALAGNVAPLLAMESLLISLADLG